MGKKEKERRTLKLDDDPLFSEWSRAAEAPATVPSQTAPSFAPYELFEEEVPFPTVPPERRERLQRYVMFTMAGCMAVFLAAAVRIGVSRTTAPDDYVPVAAAARIAPVEPLAAAPAAPIINPDDIPAPVTLMTAATVEAQAAAVVSPTESANEHPSAAPRAPEPATTPPAPPAATTQSTTVAAVESAHSSTVVGLAPAPTPPASAGPAPASATQAAPASQPAPARTAAQERELARGALEKGKLRDAAAAAERATVLDPADAEAWLILGAAKQELGQAAAARAAFQSCVHSAKHGPIGECRAMLH